MAREGSGGGDWQIGEARKICGTDGRAPEDGGGAVAKVVVKVKTMYFVRWCGFYSIMVM